MKFNNNFLKTILFKMCNYIYKNYDLHIYVQKHTPFYTVCNSIIKKNLIYNQIVNQGVKNELLHIYIYAIYSRQSKFVENGNFPKMLATTYLRNYSTVKIFSHLFLKKNNAMNHFYLLIHFC